MPATDERSTTQHRDDRLSRTGKSYGPAGLNSQTMALTPDLLLRLQRLAGNRGVTELLNGQHALPVQRQEAHPPPPPQVVLASFGTQGTALSGRALGPLSVGGYFENWVELRFSIGDADKHFKHLAPRQYSGTEALWIKRGNPITTPWVNLASGPGSGWDNPLAPSITRQAGTIAFTDSPGPNVGVLVASAAGRPSRVYSVQNFTAWIEGQGPGRAEPISPVVAWYSVVHIADRNWNDSTAPPDYVHQYGSGAGQGWRPTTAPSI